MEWDKKEEWRGREGRYEEQQVSGGARGSGKDILHYCTVDCCCRGTTFLSRRGGAAYGSCPLSSATASEVTYRLSSILQQTFNILTFLAPSSETQYDGLYRSVYGNYWTLTHFTFKSRLPLLNNLPTAILLSLLSLHPHI